MHSEHVGLGTTIVLLLWGALAVSVILRLRRRGTATFDDSFEPRDRKLVRASALYLAVPAAVLVSQLVQVGLLEMTGAGLGRFESWVFWGIVEPARPEVLSSWARSAIAMAAPLTLMSFVGAALLWTRQRPSTAARNYLRLEVARVLMSLGLGMHAIVSILIERGDYATMRAELNSVGTPLGDAALLVSGVIAAFSFWGWRRARGLRMLATGMHDATRRAEELLERWPDDPDALRSLGAGQLAVGDPKARETLSRAVEAAPRDPRAALLLGQALLSNGGDARDAATHLRRAGQLLDESDADDPPLLFEVTLALSAARIALGDAEGALLTAEAARQAQPNDLRGLLIFADALVAAGRLDEARGALAAARPTAAGLARQEIERRLAALRRR